MSERYMNDVFGRQQYQEVVGAQLPSGIEYPTLQPEGMPALRLETGVFLPNADPTSYSHERVFVQLPGFPNSLVSVGNVTSDVPYSPAPNRHSLRAASLASATDRPVVAFGFSSDLPEPMHAKIKRGDFSEISRYYVQHLKQSGVKQVDVDGYSLGGALAPDFALECLRQGIEVKSMFWGAVANAATEDGAVGQFNRFRKMQAAQGDYAKYAKESVALEQESKRLPKLSPVQALLSFAGIIKPPTTRAFALGLNHGKWRKGPLPDASSDPAFKMSEVLRLSKQLQGEAPKLVMYVGSKDPLVPTRFMDRIAKKLGLQLHVFDDRSHSLRDDLPFMNDFIVDQLAA